MNIINKNFNELNVLFKKTELTTHEKAIRKTVNFISKALQFRQDRLSVTFCLFINSKTRFIALLVIIF